jgi:hypothetical protein
MHYDTKNGVIKDRPSWFDYENCFKNLLKSIEESQVNFYINLNLIFDGNIESFNNNFISKYFNITSNESTLKYKKNIIFINAGSGDASGNKVMDIIEASNEIDDEDLIYTLENDYLHKNDWLRKIEELYKSKNHFHYVTLYDHLDKYEHTSHYVKRYDSLLSKIYVTDTHHWRTMTSTCFSFISKAKYFKRDIFYFRYLRDVFILPFLKIYKRRVLLSAIPALSTHCMTKYMAPTVDWEKINSNVGDEKFLS